MTDDSALMIRDITYANREGLAVEVGGVCRLQGEE
jgi:hypothetical protein